MKKIFIGNLPADASDENIKSLFSEYGTVRSINLVTDLFSGKCRGFGFVEMEGHEARAAIAGLDGNMYSGKLLKVKFEDTSKNKGRGRRR